MARKSSAVKDTAKLIKNEAKDVERKILKRGNPSMRFPLRALANVKYSVKKGHFEMKGKTKERTLTVNTVKTFAQTLRMMSLSKDLVEEDDIASKREAFEALFDRLVAPLETRISTHSQASRAMVRR